ncbi:hypothetical protein SGLAM104S_10495 [Streptomyces glaucescens]
MATGSSAIRGWMRTRRHPARGTGAARARRAANGSVVGTGARWGLVARGTIYLLIGVLALRIATGSGGSREADSSGAVQELARQPFGEALVWAIGIGLIGMAVWRLSEALFGASGPGGRKASKRALNAGRCVFYGFVAFSVLTFVTSSKNSEGSDATSRDLTSRALELPLGAGWWGSPGSSCWGRCRDRGARGPAHVPQAPREGADVPAGPAGRGRPGGHRRGGARSGLRGGPRLRGDRRSGLRPRKARRAWTAPCGLSPAPRRGPGCWLWWRSAWPSSVCSPSRWPATAGCEAKPQMLL